MSNDAGALMTRDVQTVAPDDSVVVIARLLSLNNISAVPVCEKNGTMIGLVSEGDLVRPFAESNALRRSWWLSLLAEGSDLAPEFLNYVRQDQRQARDLMTTPVISATESTTLPQLAELLTNHHIKRVPILRDGQVVGIVSRADLVRAMSRIPSQAAEWA